MAENFYNNFNYMSLINPFGGNGFIDRNFYIPTDFNFSYITDFLNPNISASLFSFINNSNQYPQQNYQSFGGQYQQNLNDSIFSFLNNSITSDKRKKSIQKSIENDNIIDINKNNDSQTNNLFLNAVKETAKKINCDYKDLLAVMNAESGLNPQSKNKYSGATGLIQFTRSTAKNLGTSTDELMKMDRIQQMKYVEKYLLKAKCSAGFKKDERLSAGQLYAIVFLPARAGQEVLTVDGEKYYKGNKNTDINKDGKITRTELAQRVRTFRVNESELT